MNFFDHSSPLKSISILVIRLTIILQVLNDLKNLVKI